MLRHSSPGPTKKRLRTADTDVTHLLSLNCILAGKIFSVKVELNEDICYLQDEIKKTASPTLNDIAAFGLRLWKIDRTQEEAVKLTEKDMKGPPFETMDNISEHWQGGPFTDKNIHIFVVKPPVAGFGMPADPVFAHLYEVFWRGVNSTHENHFVTRSVKVPDIETLDPNGGEQVTYTQLCIGGKDDTLEFPSAHREILITKNYEKLLRLVLDDDKAWKEARRYDRFKHASVITGQPGIGKTMFLDYLLVYRLRNKLPTIFCDMQSFVHIFTGEGVRKVILKDELVIDELQDRNCCVLINLGQKMYRTPTRFDATLRKARVVIATPPEENHLDNFTKETPCRKYYLPTWNWKDLYCASLSYSWSDNINDHNRKLRDAYIKFSGIPRHCLTDDDLLEGYTDDIKDCLTGIIPFETFIRTELHIYSTSYTLVRIEPVDEKWIRKKTTLLSKYVAEMMFERMRTYVYGDNRFSRSFDLLLANTRTRGYAGAIFEQAVHYIFRRGIEFEVELLPKDTEERNSKRCVITIREDEPCDYNTLSTQGEDIDQQYLNRYMTPVLNTADSTASVVITRDATYLFQTTVSSIHPLDLGIIKKMTDVLPANAKKTIRVVFVVPANDKATSNYRRQAGLADDSTLVGSEHDYPQYVYYLACGGI